MIYKIVSTTTGNVFTFPNAVSYTLSNNFLRIFDKDDMLVAIFKFGEGMGLIIKE